MSPSLQFAAPFAIATVTEGGTNHKLTSIASANLPQNLSQNPHPYRHIRRCHCHPQHQPPNLPFVTISRMSLRIAGLFQHFPQQCRQPFLLTCCPRCSASCEHGRQAPVPHKFIQTNRHCLPKIHRRMPEVLMLLHRNRQQPMAVAELVVTQPSLLRPEQKRHPPTLVCQLRTDHSTGIRQRIQPMLNYSLSHSSGPHH